MAADPERERRVREARAKVQQAPDDVAVRLELAAALFDAHDPAEALEQFGAVLGRDPANLQALQGAAQSAVAVGDVARASGYLRLLAALSGVSAEPAPAASLAPFADRPDDEPWPTIPREEPDEPDERRERAALREDGWDDEPADEAWRAERPTITLADVAGMDAVKRRLNVAFLAPLRDPSLGRMFGKSLRGGLLLFGPPGCGKTFVARATAGEIGARFISVGLADVLDMWLGQSERNLQAIFRTARQQRAGGAVLRRDRRPRAEAQPDGARRRAERRQPASGRAGRRRGEQRRRLRAGRHQSPVGRRHGAAPAGPLRPDGAGAPAGPAGPRGDPRAITCKAAPPRASTSGRSPGEPSSSRAPTWPTCASRRPSWRWRTRSRGGRPGRSRTPTSNAPSATSARARDRGSRRPATTPSSPTRAASTTTCWPT